MSPDPLNGIGLWVDHGTNGNVNAEVDEKQNLNPIVALAIGVAVVFGCLVLVALLML